MIPLEQLLARFKNLTNTEKVKKEAVSEAIKSVTGVVVPVSAISFSKNTIFLKVPPLIKTEIFLQKETVLKKIRTITGLGHISELK